MTQKHFEFADFVKEFKVTFDAINETQGHYDDYGKWIEGTKTPVSMEGIILPLSNDELRVEPSGTYTTHDRKVYTTQSLEIGQEIEYKSQKYLIDTEKPYSDYADVFIYYAKGVK